MQQVENTGILITISWFTHGAEVPLQENKERKQEATGLAQHPALKQKCHSEGSGPLSHHFYPGPQLRDFVWREGRVHNIKDSGVYFQDSIESVKKLFPLGLL